MASLDEIRKEQIKKLDLLKEEGINPYPTKSRFSYTLKEIRTRFRELSEKKEVIFLVGRVMLLRHQGGIIFFQLNDGTGEFQGLLRKDDVSKRTFDRFTEVVYVGDFIEIKGTTFTTKRGENSLLATDWKMLSKSLRPLPEKWHGLSDIEERFRKRYLDILSSKEIKERFILRSKLIKEIRAFLDKKGYLEVETPTLQPLYGGASAEPFMTHHNTLDVDLYLRISNELYLKRLLIAGIPKVYEIYKGFRNEGIDAVHYPEFTMLEFYESYSDAEKQMVCVEELIQTLVKKLAGEKTLEYNGHTIDFSKRFKKISYAEIFKHYAKELDFNTVKDLGPGDEALKSVANQFGVKVDKGDAGVKVLDEIFKKHCRPQIIEPTFIVEYPAAYLPLAKRKEDNEGFVDAFQLVIGGVEFVKAFSELNDPLEQRKRFEDQELRKEKGDKEAQPIDEDFLEAMEYGMPPSGGVGIGIDRLAMLLTDTKNIKEVILFPSMRSK